jgi:transglutaminase-like putative cysteine protease
MPRLSDQIIVPVSRPATPVKAALPVLLAVLAAWPAPAPKARAAAPPPRPPAVSAPAVSELASTLKKFDSLMEAGAEQERSGRAEGAYDKARALCTGGALRMFPFLALTQSKLAGLIDTAQSADTNLEESVAGDWGAVKVQSRVVFKEPFLGQTSLASVQAVHLFRSPRGWLIAEFEELEDGKTPLRLRSGKPSVDSSGEAAPATAAIPPDLFPVSPRAPNPPVAGDSLRYRLRLKNGEPLAERFPQGPSQAKAKALSPSEWIVVNRRVTPRKFSVLPDSLKPYLASNPYLDLGDSLLLATARRAAAPGSDPAEAAGDVYRWVSGNFRFSLGAVLFGTSREALRGMTGDCSEAAVLTAALLRAAGVPARVALGFASVGRGVFIGHAWTEAWLGGWVGVDAALGEYPAGVERIKLADLDGSSDMRIAATNLMLSALSNVDVELLEVWKKGKKVPLKTIRGNAGDGVEFFRQILKGVGRNSIPQ